MKRILFVFTVCLCTLSMVQAGHFTEKNSLALSRLSAGEVLQNDFLYYFPDSMTTLSIVSTKNGVSGLRVKEGATAYIYVPEGKRLYVTGGDGDGTKPAGAGIEVPATSTLYILGDGYVECHGGKSGKGTSGEDGKFGSVNVGANQAEYQHVDPPSPATIMSYSSGRGGAGGNGGGGAGAGIGGRGGAGGKGGAGANNVFLMQNGENSKPGIEGGQGGASASGANSGKIYFVGNLTVYGFSGEACSDVNVPALGMPSKNTKYGKDPEITYVAGGGGPGGTGNNGLAGMGIGGGGAGASGAGGGASGSLAGVYRLDLQDLLIEGTSFIAGTVIGVALAVTPASLGRVVLEKMPGISYLIPGFSVGMGVLFEKVSEEVIELFKTPLQANGGAGYGSFNQYCPVLQMNGAAVYQSEFHYTNVYGHSVSVACKDGGTYGTFGQTGTLHADCRRTWNSKINAEISKFTSGQYPQELITALTFDMIFDTTGVDTTHAHAGTVKIVFSDTLPQHVVIPTPRDPMHVFGGYLDHQNRLWYDRNGHALNTATDTLGQAVSVYNYPGDLKLTPRWDAYTFIWVRHHLEQVHKPADTQVEHEYGVIEHELIPLIGEQSYTVYARNYESFRKHDGKTEEIVTIHSGDTLKVVDFYYDRFQHPLNWSLPQNIQLLGDYTPAGNLRVGEQIDAAEYAQDILSGGYYRIDGWYSAADTTKLVEVGVMPDSAVTYSPLLTSLYANIHINNDTAFGTIVDVDSLLGTHMLITVSPKEGWLLDTCHAYTYSYKGRSEQYMVHNENTLALYANPYDDSIAVDVRYIGVSHTLNYSESAATRVGSMTLIVNNDTICDNGLSMPHTLRYGDYVQIRPEREHLGLRVPKQLQLTTASGIPVEVTVFEQYDGHDNYTYYYAFSMPNEDVNAVATYGYLNDNLITLRVINDEGADKVSVWSSRGLKIDTKVLTTTGYKIDAEQLVWVGLPINTLNPVDSIRLRILDNGVYTYPLVEHHLFLYSNPADTDPTQPIMPPIPSLRHSFRMPATATEVLLEIKHKNTNYRFEAETTDLHQLYDMEDGRIYTPLGVYMGTDPTMLGHGIYIRNGKKFIK